ncbi:flavin reductase [Spirochaetia bacterium]|nr:flavin reductase [Spirochaetia bacterium]GHV89913.1 flavin reductase [Spirochaetia bacterium]
MKQKNVIKADSSWIEKSIREFPGTPSERIGSGWMLITAGNAQADGSGNWNTMTASWGGLGVLWGRDVAFMFIRPSRHTFGFANDNALFTLSFFDKKYHDALSLCGEKSGRDIDKATEAGLTPIVFDGGLAEAKAAGAVGFKEASEIIVCRKLYTHDFDPAAFLDPVSIEKSYGGKDYHRMFIGEIVGLLTKK